MLMLIVSPWKRGDVCADAGCATASATVTNNRIVTECRPDERSDIRVMSRVLQKSLRHDQHRPAARCQPSRPKLKPLRRRQMCRECRTLAERAVDGQPAAVAIEDVLEQGEDKAGAALRSAFAHDDAVESLRKPRQMFRRDAGPLIAHGHAYFAAFIP